jgi:hypothetical protein
VTRLLRRDGTVYIGSSRPALPANAMTSKTQVNPPSNYGGSPQLR